MLRTYGTHNRGHIRFTTHMLSLTGQSIYQLHNASFRGVSLFLLSIKKGMRPRLGGREGKSQTPKFPDIKKPLSFCERERF